MTFIKAPWAVDGARTTSALARSAAYAAGGGRSGVTKPDHLRVLPLEVPGNGLRITRGSATVLNGYQASPDEAYTISNPGTHVVEAADMPPPVPQVMNYLVCVVIGDQEFNQAGHPFMPASPLDPIVAADFEYVRPVLVPCSPNTTSFEQLGLFYPAIALARVEVPANTSTITGAMITDLRSLAQPRTERRLLMGQPSEGSVPALTTAQSPLGNFAPFVDVPVWATWVDVLASVDSLSHLDPAVTGQLWNKIGPIQSAATYYEYDDTSANGERVSVKSALGGPCASIAGQRVQLSMLVNRTAGAGTLQIYGGTTVVFDVFFSERPIL